MITNKSELNVGIDVDLTLIGEHQSNNHAKGDYLYKFDYYGKVVYAERIDRHIDLLVAYKKRGYHVTVWSANGWQWAEQVINRLDLSEYVDVVMTKPCRYVDDSDWHSFCHRVFIPESK